MSTAKSCESQPSKLSRIKPPQEKTFSINGFTYAAQLWGNVDQLPVIAVHGWLDNSASFSVLALQLGDAQCLAIDLAGHGLSDHKSGLDDYPVWSEVAAIYAIADQMNWPRFALVGHSRGAMMALITAGVFPKRISHLIMLDSMVPPVVASADAPERMALSLSEIQRRLNRPMSLYNNYDSAINARCNSRYASIRPDSAKLLASRGLREVEGQFHWHADGKLWAASNIALSYEMVEAFAQKIADTALPCLLILGKQGLIKQAELESAFYQNNEKIKTLLSAQVEVFDDGHFLHMEHAANDVAEAINNFLLSNVDR